MVCVQLCFTHSMRKIQLYTLKRYVDVLYSYYLRHLAEKIYYFFKIFLQARADLCVSDQRGYRERIELFHNKNLSFYLFLRISLLNYSGFSFIF